MLRGIIIGLFSGGCLGLLVAAAVSLVAPLPAHIDPQTTAEAPSGQPNSVAETSDLAPSTGDAPLQTDNVAQAPEGTVSADGSPAADQSSAPKPETSDGIAMAAAPDAGEAGGVSLALEEPVLPNPQTGAMDVPAGAPEDASISEDPAQPSSPTDIDTAAFTAPEITPAPKATEVAQPDVEAEPVAPEIDSESVAAAPQASEQTQSAGLLQEAGDLNETFPQLRSTRLPTIGGDAAAEATDASDVPEVVATAPIEAFAAAFENPENKPLLSVVLIDIGDSAVDLATLAAFPLPLSIAVDAAARDATARMAAFRAEGLEVVALANLPAGAQPTDIEVNLQSQLGAVNEAVAVLDGQDGGLQENREVSDQVIAIIQDSGHGLIMQPKGLNTAQKMALREGVPSMTVFRDFDGAGQTEVVMRRFLDQSAFKARQENGVIMLGRLKPDTLSALAVWALADRAGTVALAPVSAVLSASQN